MKRILILFFVISFSCFVSGHAGEKLSPEDFAFGLPVEISEGGLIYEVQLPLEFYQGVVRSDLGDVRVFNGRREIVPHAIKKPGWDDPRGPYLYGFRFFPVPGDPKQSAEGFSVMVQRDAEGHIVGLYRSDGTPEQSGTAAYLVDASRAKRPLKSLELSWKLTTENFLGKVTVKGSDDFEHWSVLAADAIIAGMEYGEHKLSQKKIAFAPTTLKYISVSWPAELQRVQLRSVVGEMVKETADQKTQWISVPGVEVKDRPGDYLFTLPGRIPSNRLRVKLPRKDTFISASILTRDEEKNPWLHKGGIGQKYPIYRLTLMGEELRNRDFTLSPSTNRFWLLRIDPGGGGLGEGLPECEFGCVFQQLLFEAQGDGPFLIAFGNGRQELKPISQHDLPVGFRDDNVEQISAQPASVLPRVVLGGKSRSGFPSFDAWLNWALWGSLILAAALLGWMALRVVGSIVNRDPDDS